MAADQPDPISLDQERVQLEGELSALQDEMHRVNTLTLQIEKGMLDFYYNHSIHSEREGGQTSTSPRTAESDLSKLLEEKQRNREHFLAEQKQVAERVEQLKSSLEKEVIHGSLESQRVVLSKEEKELKSLENTMHELKASIQQIQQSIHKEEGVQLALQQEQCEHEKKKRRIDDHKRQLMENADKAKEDLLLARTHLEEAKAELHRRELNIDHLKGRIEELVQLNKHHTSRES